MAIASDHHDDGGNAAITGINVTPLVDVTLVLLIVFLVTAKVIVSQAIPLEALPRIAAPGAVQTTLSIAIDEHGVISLDGSRVASDADLVRAAKKAHDQDKDVRAVIRASSKAEHGSVVRVIDALRTGEVTRIAFAVQKGGTVPQPTTEP
jgi:biopolymer transport protein ExbD